MWWMHSHSPKCVFSCMSCGLILLLYPHLWVCVSFVASFVFFFCHVLLFIANGPFETLAEFLLVYVAFSSPASRSLFVCDNSQLVLCPDYWQTVLWDVWVSVKDITQCVWTSFKLWILCSNHPCDCILPRNTIVPFASNSGMNLVLLSMFHELQRIVCFVVCSMSTHPLYCSPMLECWSAGVSRWSSSIIYVYIQLLLLLCLKSIVFRCFKKRFTTTKCIYCVGYNLDAR